MTALRDRILSRKKLPLEKVLCPEWSDEEWDGTLFVRTVKAGERCKFEADSLIKKGRKRETNLENIRARMVALTACDEQGNRLFTEEDVKELTLLSAKPMGRIYDAACKLNGWTDEDVEEMAKN
jgi:hypothetical protein